MFWSANSINIPLSSMCDGHGALNNIYSYGCLKFPLRVDDQPYQPQVKGCHGTYALPPKGANVFD